MSVVSCIPHTFLVELFPPLNAVVELSFCFRLLRLILLSSGLVFLCLLVDLSLFLFLHGRRSDGDCRSGRCHLMIDIVIVLAIVSRTGHRWGEFYLSRRENRRITSQIWKRGRRQRKNSGIQDRLESTFRGQGNLQPGMVYSFQIKIAPLCMHLAAELGPHMPGPQ